MNHVFRTEVYKFRKNRMVLIGFLAPILVPVLLLLKALLIDRGSIECREWIMTVSMVVGLVFPTMSGFLITQSVQREYGEKTIINILAAPVKRSTLILSKTAAWFCWYVVVLAVTELLTIAGANLLYGREVSVSVVLFIIKLYTETELLSFIAFLPVIWVTVKQRTLFYPSMLCTLVFVCLQSAGTQISENMLPAASLVPWMAVTVFPMLETDSFYYYVCLCSVSVSGILGIVLAVSEFKKQDL